jgi:hypothetical protein
MGAGELLVSLRSSTLYRDRHLISEGWLPPREAKALRGDLEKVRQENERLREAVEVARDFTTQGTINGEPATIKFCDLGVYLRAVAIRTPTSTPLLEGDK